MKLWLFSLLFVQILTTGCSTQHVSGDIPPNAMVEIGDQSFNMKLGSFCWGNRCVDTIGPVDLLKNQQPIQVSPGQAITVVMDYEPKPNEIHVTQFNEGEDEEIELKDGHMIAPSEKGIYYYSYGVWWKDDKDPHLSHGDAFYAFVIEVE